MLIGFEKSRAFYVYRVRIIPGDLYVYEKAVFTVFFHIILCLIIFSRSNRFPRRIV